MIDNAQRKAILEKEVMSYVRLGYLVQSKDEFTAQLVRPKRFSFILAVFLLLLAVFPFFIYLLLYLAGRDKTVYIAVSEEGKVTRR